MRVSLFSFVRLSVRAFVHSFVRSFFRWVGLGPVFVTIFVVMCRGLYEFIQLHLPFSGGSHAVAGC